MKVQQTKNKQLVTCTSVEYRHNRFWTNQVALKIWLFRNNNNKEQFQQIKTKWLQKLVKMIRNQEEDQVRVLKEYLLHSKLHNKLHNKLLKTTMYLRTWEQPNWVIEGKPLRVTLTKQVKIKTDLCLSALSSNPTRIPPEHLDSITQSSQIRHLLI